MRGKVGDVERRQLAEGPFEHGHAGVTGEPRGNRNPSASGRLPWTAADRARPAA